MGKNCRCVLLGASDTYPVKSTGGSATHTQTAAEIETHTHGYGNQYSGEAHFGKWNFYVPNVIQITDDEGKNCAWATTTNIGNSQPMDILNPYYAVNIWHRIE